MYHHRWSTRCRWEFFCVWSKIMSIYFIVFLNFVLFRALTYIGSNFSVKRSLWISGCQNNWEIFSNFSDLQVCTFLLVSHLKTNSYIHIQPFWAKELNRNRKKMQISFTQIPAQEEAGRRSRFCISKRVSSKFRFWCTIPEDNFVALHKTRGSCKVKDNK